jgi:D-alanyl-D-alanine carboxypeptidase
MFCVRIGAWTGARSAVWLLTAAAIVTAIDPADAKHRHRHGPAAAMSNYSPPASSIVVDANSGKVLQESEADGLRHPASLTKIMTLYLLFERLDAGKIKLDTALKVSEHAANQAPSKLGLEPGESIAVEDAIRAVVTKSANDVAVVIAEALGGDENEFARMMTAKAHALGMSHTEYRNASGLPDDNQITTARDLALLGRAIQERFPRYYRYFATPSFTYHGDSMRNHNHLLGSVEGVDGIKTGYTQASGFNLATSMRRGNRHLVAVVLGGRSAGERDARMRELLERNLARASDRHSAPIIAENTGEQRAKQTFALAAVPPAGTIAAGPTHAEPTVTATASPTKPAPGSSDPIKPIQVKTILYKVGSARAASLDAAPLQASPTTVTEVAQPQIVATKPDPAPKAPIINPQPGVLGVLPARIAAQPLPEPPPQQPATPSSAPVLQVMQINRPSVPTPAPPAQATASTPAQAVAAVAQEPAPTSPKADDARPASVRTGWLIQVGALESESEAKTRLDLAQSKAKDALRRAEPFTETVTKGDKTLYRARFAGFDKEQQAEAACKSLKHADIPCMALKN